MPPHPSDDDAPAAHGAADSGMGMEAGDGEQQESLEPEEATYFVEEHEVYIRAGNWGWHDPELSNRPMHHQCEIHQP